MFFTGDITENLSDPVADGNDEVEDSNGDSSGIENKFEFVRACTSSTR